MPDNDDDIPLENIQVYIKTKQFHTTVKPVYKANWETKILVFICRWS